MNIPFSYICAPSGHQRGFTLIELLVTVSVLAVLLAMGVPSFQGMLGSNTLTSQTNDLVSSLNLARSEAIRRGTRVTVCKSSDASSCATTGNWTQGWITFVDTTRSGTTAVVNTGETILAVHQTSSGTVSIKGSSSVDSYVSYASDGRAKLISGNAQSGTLRICNSSTTLTNANRARDLSISAVGRVASSTPSSVLASCPSP